MTGDQPSARTRRHLPWPIGVAAIASFALGLARTCTKPGTTTHIVLAIATVTAVIATLFLAALAVLNPRHARPMQFTPTAPGASTNLG